MNMILDLLKMIGKVQLRCAGLGWEVWCDGMEITQFTYFQQMAGYECKPVSVEITYGLERICMFTQQQKNVYDLFGMMKGEISRCFSSSRKRIFSI